jgi:predicted RNA binding protein with dsRBD fold (UPF0201 family)
MQLIAKTPIHPTEDRTKVEQCFQNIFGNYLEFEEEQKITGRYLIARSSKPEVFDIIFKKLRSERILDSARKILLRNMTIDSVNFLLNKQAAFMGRIHFVTDPEQEDFLGPISITITSEDIQKFIDWLTLLNSTAS